MEVKGRESKTIINVVFGLCVCGLIVLAVIFAILNNNVRADMEGIRSGEVYAKSITYDKLSDDVFTSVEITLADGTETTAKLISGEVVDGLLEGELELVLADGTTVIAEVYSQVPELEIGDGSITEEKLAEVVVAKLNAEAVVEADCEFELADGSVTTLKLLNGSITSGKLQDGIILTQHLGVSSVTTINIADDSITTSKILDNVVSSAKLADGSIDNVDISAAADISWSKVSKVGSSLADLTTKDAVDLDIADAGGYFVATQVEGALQELADGTILDSAYLKLDASNDPITGALTITPSADGASILNVTTSGGTPVLSVNTTTERAGIGVADPDTRLEILYAGNQLKLSFDGTDNAVFAVDTSGNLTITPSGTSILVPSKLAFTQTDLGEYIDSLNDGYLDFRATIAHRFGDGTNYTEIKADGEINLHGTARVTVDMYITASGVKAPGLKPPEFVEHGLTGVWQFGDEGVEANQESISGTLKLPAQMDKTAVPVFKVGWSADGVSPGDCEWQLEYLYRSPNEATNDAAQETLTATGTASTTSNGFVITAFSGIALPSATDQAMFFKITRLSAGVNDTIVDDVELRGMLFTHTRDKLGTGL